MIAEKMRVMHPGEVLSEEFLIPMGLSRYGPAKETFLDVTRISKIVRGERGISRSLWRRHPGYF